MVKAIDETYWKANNKVSLAIRAINDQWLAVSKRATVVAGELRKEYGSGLVTPAVSKHSVSAWCVVGFFFEGAKPDKTWVQCKRSGVFTPRSTNKLYKEIIAHELTLDIPGKFCRLLEIPNLRMSAGGGVFCLNGMPHTLTYVDGHYYFGLSCLTPNEFPKGCTRITDKLFQKRIK